MAALAGREKDHPIPEAEVAGEPVGQDGLRAARGGGGSCGCGCGYGCGGGASSRASLSVSASASTSATAPPPPDVIEPAPERW